MPVASYQTRRSWDEEEAEEAGGVGGIGPDADGGVGGGGADVGFEGFPQRAEDGLGFDAIGSIGVGEPTEFEIVVGRVQSAFEGELDHTRRGEVVGGAG